MWISGDKGTGRRNSHCEGPETAEAQQVKTRKNKGVCAPGGDSYRG